ncbi:hypothetical protein PRK78_002084 [Emydomyces testavorans]|uniref:Uncharacterized protein n=1 Tax=Emydomyces testavorans TaxID=2070801 RepID=A0AAF0IHH3_9EURO|nr:hypothetical protein PRK78_002084 [Emydomyces testavorans]
MSLPRTKFEHPASASATTSAFHPYHPWARINSADYIEQARSALESQRISFECERAAFAEERKLWEKERRIMQQRIAELEIAEGKESVVPATGAQAEIPRGPEMIEQHHVWEGSHPTARPSRIFPTDIPHADHEPIGHGFSPSLDEALSPKSRPVDHASPVSVPIELVDSSLDGITLKSTALSPGIVAKVSPPCLSVAHSLIPLHQPVGTELKPGLQPQEQRCLASPFGGIPSDTDRTPMAHLDQTAEAGFPFPIDETIIPESPHEPLPSLFPIASIDQAAYPEAADEDPALQGPLNLQNDHKEDTEFLEELDQKLLKEARRALSRPLLSSDEEDEGEGEPPEPEPEIRFKHSTNFGTAFGSTQIES